MLLCTRESYLSNSFGSSGTDRKNNPVSPRAVITVGNKRMTSPGLHFLIIRDRSSLLTLLSSTGWPQCCLLILFKWLIASAECISDIEYISLRRSVWLQLSQSVYQTVLLKCDSRFKSTRIEITILTRFCCFLWTYVLFIICIGECYVQNVAPGASYTVALNRQHQSAWLKPFLTSLSLVAKINKYIIIIKLDSHL